MIKKKVRSGIDHFDLLNHPKENKLKYMNWNKLDSEEILENIQKESFDQPVLIFKHSTRCSISSMAFDRMQRSWKEDEMSAIKPYYLDLITYRNISNKVSQHFNTEHESPQLLMIVKGNCVYNVIHMEISHMELRK